MQNSSQRNYRFAPEVGNWRIELTSLARSLASPTEDVLKDIEQEAEEVLAQATEPRKLAPSAERLRYAFALSLLHDILNVGGTAQVLDSEIFVSWPDWQGVENREVTHRALKAVAGRRHIRQREAR